MGELRARLARNPLPEGTLAVGAGLVLAGVGAYTFLVVSAALGPDEYAPLSVLWALVFLAGPGCFLPVEQEISRALAERHARGVGAGPLLRRAALLGLVVLAVLLVALAAAGPALVDHLFHDEVLLVIGLALAMVGACGSHLARGTCSGTGRFGPYGFLIGSESMVRVALCIALAVAGTNTVGPYGLVVGVAPIIAVTVTMLRQRGIGDAGPDASWGELSGALAALLAGSLLAQGLVNAGPVVVQLLASEAEHDEAGRFLAGLVIARVPLFLFQAVQAALLPKLSGLAGAGRFDDFRAGLRRLLVATIALGSIATVGAFAVGPEVVRLLFGAEFELDHRTLGLLAAGCALYMVAIALAQAVIALSGHRLVAGSWALAMAAFIVVVTWAADDLFLRVELGLLAGSAAAVAALASALVSRLRAGAEPEPGTVIEALHDLEPFV